MNYHGTVKLILGQVVKHEFAYFSREERNKIVERWRDIYAADRDWETSQTSSTQRPTQRTRRRW